MHRVTGLTARAVFAFYEHLFFPFVADTLLCELATCGKRFQLFQREIVLQAVHFEEQTEYVIRRYTFRTAGEVETTMRSWYENRQRDPNSAVVTLHFGPVWPSHHIHDQPLLAVPSYLSTSHESRPRHLDRVAAQRGVASACGELIIDVDFDCATMDRNTLCQCGTASRVCNVCWMRFMWPAQLVLEHLLRHFFEFKAFFTVFSGRRGFHIWVVDKRVIQWTYEQRTAFMAVLQRKHTDNIYDEMADMAYKVLEPLYQYAPDRRACFDALYPVIDAKVTTEPGHLHKVPLMLNHNTGFLCIIMGDADNPKDRFEAIYGVDILTVDAITPAVIRGCVAKVRAVLKRA
jgi:hypothetical protein